MKDKRGVQRGPCKEVGCECLQYWLPPPDCTGSKHFCEYCNHLPGKHLPIVPLGYCTGCGKDNCSKYEPEDDISYSECQYCGCEASCHKGGELLKVPANTGTSTNVKVDASGKPLQSFAQGPCKRPGCTYGKRVDPTTGGVMNYCSKTCARMDSARPTQVMTVSGDPSQMLASLDPGVMRVEMPPGTVQSVKKPSQCVSKSTTHNPSSSSSGVSPAVCTKCNVNPANPGRKWCQQCFLAKPSTS